MPVPQFVQTNIDKIKLTKTRMLKNKQFYFITTEQITNTKVVMFINFPMYRGVCVFISKQEYF